MVRSSTVKLGIQRSLPPSVEAETLQKIECRMINGPDTFKRGQRITCTIRAGFLCVASDQWHYFCEDYGVRYYCDYDGNFILPHNVYCCCGQLLEF